MSRYIRCRVAYFLNRHMGYNRPSIRNFLAFYCLSKSFQEIVPSPLPLTLSDHQCFSWGGISFQGAFLNLQGYHLRNHRSPKSSRLPSLVLLPYAREGPAVSPPSAPDKTATLKIFHGYPVLIPFSTNSLYLLRAAFFFSPKWRRTSSMVFWAKGISDCAPVK